MSALRRRTSGPTAVSPALVVAVAALLGTGAGYLLSGTRDEPVVRDGPLTLRAATLLTPAGWRTEVASFEVPGFPTADTLAQRRGASSVLATELAPGPFLLPDALRPLVAEAGTARAGSLGAVRWRMTPRARGGATEVLAVPTTRATIVLACRARTPADAGAACVRGLRDLRLRIGAPIRPDLAAPVAQALPAVLPTYNTAATAARRDLRTARTDAARARAAERAAGAARRARTVLARRVAPNPEARELLAGFDVLARGYGDLRRGYARDSWPTKSRGVAAVRAAERRLGDEVERIRVLLQPLAGEA